MHHDTKHFEHLVEFYNTEEYLVNTLVDYFTIGLTQGEACIIVATHDHRLAFERKMKELGNDMKRAEMNGQYIPLDAAVTLAHFYKDGEVSSDAFNEIIGSMIHVTAQRKVRAYGEMVALLWQQGQAKAAIELEELWNGLGAIRDFTLLCAYPSSLFSAGDAITEVCATHSSVKHEQVM